MAIRNVFGSRDGREKKTLANKDYYKTLIDSKKEATFLADTDGDLFLFNKKAQQITGFSEEEIRELHIRDIFISLKNEVNPFDSRQFSEFTAPLYLLDARRYLIPVMVDFKEIEGQKFLCTFAESVEKETLPVSKEITGYFQEEFPLPLQPATANEMQLRMPADFEHRVRNLLNSILGFGSILAREPSIVKDKKLSGNLESIINSGNQLKTIFNQVSIGETASYEVIKTTISLEPLLQKTAIILDPVSKRNNLKITIKQKAAVSVISDEFLLLELMKFLLEKALLYTRNDVVTVEVSGPGDGKVTLAIDNLGQDIPQGVINFIKRENNREIYDLGNPIIANNQEIKEMLHILNRIDAKISFSTSSSMSEIAILTIPAAVEDANTDDLSLLEAAIRSKALNILIVEDEKLTARILTIYISDIADVSLAYSGNEALNIVETFYNKGKIFNAVIMDVGLPKPWDGILLKKEIEKRWPEYQNIPFLAQTAYTSKSYTDRISESKFLGYLLKPINRIDVLRFLEKYCK